VEENEEEFLLYTAKTSKFIFVVKLFDDFAMIRSASPEHYGEVHKLDLMTFTKEFEEYCGDHDIIYEGLFGDEDKELSLLE
jgi:hypothetical protein